MAADESIDWELGKAPKQSITELLHNPRGPKLELPEVTLELPALSLTPVPLVNIPEPLDINHFESYLRHYAPIYEAYQAQKTAVIPSPRPLDTVPSHYFQSDFSLATNEELASLSSDEPLSDNPNLPHIRRLLSTHKATLEHHLKRVLDEQEPALTHALKNINHLRETILSTATALRETRQSAETLLPTVITPIAATQRLTQAQTNLRALKSALQSIQVVTSAPSDVAVLLDAGEYAAAIDAVHSAREELAHPHLARITSLAPVRARLAQSVESIDASLRRQFRGALADANHALLREVVALVSRLGRLSTLHRFFMREIKDRLSQSIAEVSNVSQAAKVVKTSAESAVMLVRIIHDDSEENKDARLDHLQEAHGDFEEMLAAIADRVLGSFTVGAPGGFVVITRPEMLMPETCFDEFKAALKFGEEIRSLDDLATELEGMFCVEKRGGALRAKIAERQIAFLSAFHKAHTDALTQAVRADKWQEMRVPDGATRLLAAVVEIPSANILQGESSGATESNRVVEDMTGNKPSVEAEATAGTFLIGFNSFKTVACGVRYVRSMCAYTLLVEKSPTLASEIARRGADFCRNFNSLVGKAILGAAALQWAGLRSITARHLSLASRTIALAACLAEYTNKPLENALSGAQSGVVLPLLQKSEKDLRDHHGQLLAKILAIMMDRLEAHETVLKSLPWDKYQEMQRFDIPSAYVVTLSKEATVLHRILWSILPKTEVFDIFQRVCAAYGTHLSEAYSTLDGGKRWIRIRVAKDVVCLHGRLLALDVFKANPESFKPLSKMYDRFSKDSLEEEAKNPGGRSFNRQSRKEAPKLATTEGSIKLKESTSKRNHQEAQSTKQLQDDQNIAENQEHSAIVNQVDKKVGTDSKVEHPTDMPEKATGDTEQPPRYTAKRKSDENVAKASGDMKTPPSDPVTKTNTNELIKSDSASSAGLVDLEKPSESEVLVNPQENGHMDPHKPSEPVNLSTAASANKDETEVVEDLLNREVDSADANMEGSAKKVQSPVAEGDLLNLEDNG